MALLNCIDAFNVAIGIKYAKIVSETNKSYEKSAVIESFVEVLKLYRGVLCRDIMRLQRDEATAKKRKEKSL